MRHTGRLRGGETVRGQFLRGPRQGAPQVVLRVGMPARETGAAGFENGGDVRGGQAPLQQPLGDPFIGNAPVRLWEPPRNVQPVQPSLVEFGRGVDRQKGAGAAPIGERVRRGGRVQRGGGPGTGGPAPPVRRPEKRPQAAHTADAPRERSRWPGAAAASDW